jgi:hypothetical protein
MSRFSKPETFAHAVLALAPGSLLAMEAEDSLNACHEAATYPDGGKDYEDLDHYLEGHERDLEEALVLADVLAVYAEEATRFAA